MVTTLHQVLVQTWYKSVLSTVINGLKEMERDSGNLS